MKNGFSVVPAIDIIDWDCVRLYKWDYDQKKCYTYSPLEMAKTYEEKWYSIIHLVDLDWAKAGKVINTQTLKDIIDNTNIDIEFGGWIRSIEELSNLFEIWIKYANIWSIAINDPRLFKSFIDRVWADKISVWVDIKDWEIKSAWWLEWSSLDRDEFIRELFDMWIRRINVTDISKDWTLTWPNFEMYEDIQSKFLSMEIIASWGVGTIEDVHKLKEIWISWSIVGKAIYEDKIDLDELSKLND